MTITAWYFAKTDNRLGYDDGREIIIGETHSVSTDERPVKCCLWGLHGSKRIIDALHHSAGPIIYRVELSGEIDECPDKVAASQRKYLWGFDAANVLYAFARRCALEVAHLWDAPDVVREWLQTGNGAIEAAANDIIAKADRTIARGAAKAVTDGPARNAAWRAYIHAAYTASSGEILDEDMKAKFSVWLEDMVISERESINARKGKKP